MIVVVAQCGVDLRQGQVSMLEMDLLRAPAVSDRVKRNLNDLCVRVVNPRHSSIIKPNMGGRWNQHCRTLAHRFASGNVFLLPFFFRARYALGACGKTSTRSWIGSFDEGAGTDGASGGAC